MGSTEAKAKWLRASRPPSSISSSSKSETEERSSDLPPPDIKWWSHQQHKPNDAGSFWNPQWEEVGTVNSDTLQKKIVSEVESEWLEIKKNEPWWRKADLNDLDLLKSHQHFDSCDLPLPQTNKTESLACDRGLASLHQEKSTFTNSIRPFSTKEAKNLETGTPISQLSKTELLEALCRSQIRAKEAEKAAQRACNEKQHVITLFLKQASQIFAYKQWLYILHLETLCNHRKYHPIHTRYPDFVPTKGKLPKRAHKMNKSVGDFVLGLALVGAGVLLGWTTQCYSVGPWVAYFMLSDFWVDSLYMCI